MIFALTPTDSDLPEPARIFRDFSRSQRRVASNSKRANQARESFGCIPRSDLRQASGFVEGPVSPHTLAGSTSIIFRKEVIQPQVLLRLPCYDFTPIMSHTLGACLL